MPSLAPSLRSCGCVVKPGDRCAHMRASDRERKARHDQNRPSARQRGYSTDWDKERAKFLSQNPYCVQCGKKATHVDHIVPHKGSRRLFWAKWNWQALCEHHHNSWKQSEERRNG